jgi:hypothetical protein
MPLEIREWLALTKISRWWLFALQSDFWVKIFMR